jgi:hypothetical protein
MPHACPAFRIGEKMPDTRNGRDNQIDVEQINRNIQTTEDSYLESPFNEEIMAGDADYGDVLFNSMPEDRVGFLSNGHKRK